MNMVFVFLFVCQNTKVKYLSFFALIESLFGVHGMGMLVLSDIFCTFSRNTELPNFGNIFREKYSSYFYKQGVIWKVIQFREFSYQLFHLRVSSLFCGSLYISPKKFPKKWNFSKSKHLIDEYWRENLDIWLNNNPQSIRPIAVSLLD